MSAICRVLFSFLIVAAAVGAMTNAVEGGIYLTVDSDENGAGVDAWYASSIFDVSGTVLFTIGGVSLEVTVSPSESADFSQLLTADTTINTTGGAPSSAGTVTIRALYTDLLLPPGTPLLLSSGVIALFPSTTNLASMTNTSYQDQIAVVDPGFPIPTTGLGAAPFSFTTPAVGGLLASIVGPLPGAPFFLEDTEFASTDRTAATFDLLSEITISYTGLTAIGEALDVTASTTVTGVPELSSIVAWAVCAGLGSLIAYRRRRVIG